MKEDSTLSKLDLRNLITPAETNCLTPWVLETPKCIRESSVFEAVKNRKACFSNLKNNHITHFKLGYLSKSRERKWTLGGIDNLKRLEDKLVEMFPTLGLGRFKTREKLPKEIKNACSIHFDGLYYYLIVPVEKCIKKFSKKPVISSDPGVRTFHTLYDPVDQVCYKVGKNAQNKIFNNMLKLDFMVSSKKCKKKSLKCRLRIQHLQDELHWKVAHWLCKQYKKIVIPVFGSKNMVLKSTRNIQTKTVRHISALCHGKFLEKLKTKAQEFASDIQIVSEKYTTMTCGNCKHLDRSIGSNKQWICKHCNWFHDRDINASRNILLKLDTA